MNLPDLPPSEEKEFWGDAERELSDIKKRKEKQHEHRFVRINAKEVQCECGFGLFIDDPSDQLADGHLYHDGQFIV